MAEARISDGLEHPLVGLRALEVDAEEVGDALDLGTELAVELVAADPGEVVALGVEEGVLEVLAGGLDRQRLAGTGPLVDLEQGLLAGRSQALLLLPLALEEVEVADEALEEALVAVAEGAQQDEQREPALAGHPGAGGHVLGRLGLDVELDPLAPVGVDGAGEDRLGVAAGLEDDPRRANQLADDDPLGAVDDEGALVRHHREVPHEDGLLLDLARLRVHEPGPHEHRGGVGHVLFLALLHRELGRWAQVGIGRVELELEAQLTGEVLDGADVAERLGQAAVEEPLERVPLDGDQVGQGQGLVDVGEGKSFRAVGPRGQRPTPPSCGSVGRRRGTAVMRGLRVLGAEVLRCFETARASRGAGGGRFVDPDHGSTTSAEGVEQGAEGASISPKNRQKRQG